MPFELELDLPDNTCERHGSWEPLGAWVASNIGIPPSECPRCWATAVEMQSALTGQPIPAVVNLWIRAWLR